jgi:hypothetical protein
MFSHQHITNYFRRKLNDESFLKQSNVIRKNVRRIDVEKLDDYFTKLLLADIEVSAPLTSIDENSLPKELISLYLKCDGQSRTSKGMFQCLSGHSKVSKLRLLPINEISDVKSLLSDDKFKDIYKETDIPFAIEQGVLSGDVLCFNEKDKKIYLLWTSAPDWTLPFDWQINRIEYVLSFDNFIDVQMEYISSIV